MPKGLTYIRHVGEPGGIDARLAAVAAVTGEEEADTPLGGCRGEEAVDEWVGYGIL